MAGMGGIYSIVVDSAGNIYITKTMSSNYGIQKYSSAGAAGASVQIPDGYECMWITIDGNDNIYAVHSGGLNKYSTGLSLLSSISKEFTAKGICTDETYIYILYTDLTYSHKISKYNLSLNHIATATFSGYNVSAGVDYYNGYIYANLYNTDTGNYDTVKFSADFTDGLTISPSVLISSSSESNFLKVNNTGIYLAQSVVEQYSLTGEYVASPWESGSAEGQVSGPIGIFIK